MKRLFTLLTVMLLVATCWAQNADYLLKKDFQSEKKKISEGIDAAKKAGFDAKRIATKQVLVFDSLEKSLSGNEKVLKQFNDSLQKTTASFTYLKTRLDNISSKTKFYLRMIVVIFIISLLLILSIIFFQKKKSDEKIQILEEENKNLSEILKIEVDKIKEELKKSTNSILLTVHEFSANAATKIEQQDGKLEGFSAGLKEHINKFEKEQAANKSYMEEKLTAFLTKVEAEKNEHHSTHEKIDSEVKGLRSLHIKDIEELKAKL